MLGIAAFVLFFAMVTATNHHDNHGRGYDNNRQDPSIMRDSGRVVGDAAGAVDNTAHATGRGIKRLGQGLLHAVEAPFKAIGHGVNNFDQGAEAGFRSEEHQRGHRR